jgi:hypothetical protein
MGGVGGWIADVLIPLSYGADESAQGEAHAEANADLIVRAVNAHEELVTQCVWNADILRSIKRIAETKGATDPNWAQVAKHIQGRLDATDAALKLAKGKE